MNTEDFYLQVNDDAEMVENASSMVDSIVPDKEAQPEHTDRVLEYIALLDCLQTNGVDPVQAVRYVQSLVASDPSVSVVYGRGSIVGAANSTRRNLNIKGLSALDIRTFKENGQPWDFSKASDRQEARTKLRVEKPKWLIGSPPCTYFSSLMNLNFAKMDATEVER